jgi:hypothetical protein
MYIHTRPKPTHINAAHTLQGHLVVDFDRIRPSYGVYWHAHTDHGVVILVFVIVIVYA